MLKNVWIAIKNFFRRLFGVSEPEKPKVPMARGSYTPPKKHGGK